MGQRFEPIRIEQPGGEPKEHGTDGQADIELDGSLEVDELANP